MIVTYLLLLGIITINGLLINRHFSRVEDRIQWIENNWNQLKDAPAVQARAICGCGHDKAFHDKEGQCHWKGPEPGAATDLTMLMVKPSKRDYAYTDDFRMAVESYHSRLQEIAAQAPTKSQTGPCGCQGYNGPDVEYLPQVVG